MYCSILHASRYVVKNRYSALVCKAIKVEKILPLKRDYNRVGLEMKNS